MLYQLTISVPEPSYNEHHEDFSIGIFHSRKEAEEIANCYLSNVKGFCNHPCTYKITERVVSGQPVEENSEVYIAVGWNTNESLDEIDIIESPCFVSESQAAAALEQMKVQHYRSEWTVQC